MAPKLSPAIWHSTSLAFHLSSTIHIQHHRDSIISSAQYPVRPEARSVNWHPSDIFGRAWHPPGSLPSTTSVQRGQHSLRQSQWRIYISTEHLSEHFQASAILFLRPKRHNLVRSHPNLPSPPSMLIHLQTDSELIAKRRLGQTNLAVKPGQVGTSNATKPENLGPFDYAHLRAPLPRNLKGSEIFAPHQNQPTPEVYFLMVRVSSLSFIPEHQPLTMLSHLQRRSTDGYVSATGMFKAAFPWAKHAEENAERDYVKSLPSTAQDEVAGNVWVSELYGALLR